MNVNIFPSVNKDNYVEFLIQFKNNGIMNNKDFIANTVLKNYLVREFRKNKSKCEENLKKGETPVWQKVDDEDDYVALNLINYGMNLGLSCTCFYLTLDLLRLEDFISSKEDVKDKRNKLITKAIDYITRQIYQGINENSYKEILDNFDTYYQANAVSTEYLLAEAKHKFTINGLDEYTGIRTVEYENEVKRPSFKTLCDVYEKGYSVSNLDINIIGDVEKSDILKSNIERIVNGIIDNNKQYETLIFPQDTVVNKTLTLNDEKNIMGYSAVDFELPYLEDLDREIDIDKDTCVYSMKVLRSHMPKLNSLKDYSIPYLVGVALSKYTEDYNTGVDIDYANLSEIEDDKSELQIRYKGANETDEVKNMVKILKDKFNIDTEDKLFNLKKMALSEYREDNWELKWVMVYSNNSSNEESDFIKSLADITLEEFNEFIDNLIELTTVQIRYYDFSTIQQ